MECAISSQIKHRDWRRWVKKERRRRLRQKVARARNEAVELLRKKLENDPDHVRWIEEQEELEAERKKLEEEEHAKAEQAWLNAEVKAQKEWKILQEKKAKARELQLEQEAKIRREYEEMQDTAKKKRDAEKRRREEQKKLFDRMKKEIDAFIDDGARTPKALRNISETQPGKEICPFFNKTGACRYGDICSRNHQRPGLSTVVLVPNFYTHFSLEKHRDEYDTDVRLEYDHRETRNHFRDFYFDVVPELEKFGKIKTLQYCKNTESHLRGNLYIEYMTEREAARALRGLKGRWYAGRQLHCEFVSLKSWRGAICGMMRCPKGSSCNFLHTFRNPTEDYGVKSPPLWQKRQEMFDKGSGTRDSSSRRGQGGSSSRRSNWEDDNNRDKNWRWSESPEPNDRRGYDRGRQNQYNNRSMQRNFNNRNNQYQNRNFDNRRDNRGFNNYNDRGHQRHFNDNRNRFQQDNRFNRPQQRRFNNFNDRFRKHSGSDDGDDYRMKRRERRSADRRTRSRSRVRSRSRSGSRSRTPGSRSPSRSRSRSRSHSRSRSRSPSHSRSISRSRSRSRSRTRSRSMMNDQMIDIEELRARKGGRPTHSTSRSPTPERKRRPPSPDSKDKVHEKISKKPTQNLSKWDNEKRNSSTESRYSRSRSRSPSPAPYKRSKQSSDNIQQSQQRQHPQQASMQHPLPQQSSKPASDKPRSKSQKDYEWDTTDSEN